MIASKYAEYDAFDDNGQDAAIISDRYAKYSVRMKCLPTIRYISLPRLVRDIQAKT